LDVFFFFIRIQLEPLMMILPLLCFLWRFVSGSFWGSRSSIRRGTFGFLLSKTVWFTFSRPFRLDFWERRGSSLTFFSYIQVFKLSLELDIIYAISFLDFKLISFVSSSKLYLFPNYDLIIIRISFFGSFRMDSFEELLRLVTEVLEMKAF